MKNELKPLIEFIAAGIHDEWMNVRLNDGWTYGPERNDKKLQHPCLVPYDELPGSEKEYDRNTAVKTIAMIEEAGFDIIKK